MGLLDLAADGYLLFCGNLFIILSVFKINSMICCDLVVPQGSFWCIFGYKSGLNVSIATVKPVCTDLRSASPFPESWLRSLTLFFGQSSLPSSLWVVIHLAMLCSVLCIITWLGQIACVQVQKPNSVGENTLGIRWEEMGSPHSGLNGKQNWCRFWRLFRYLSNLALHEWLIVAFCKLDDGDFQRYCSICHSLVIWVALHTIIQGNPVELFFNAFARFWLDTCFELSFSSFSELSVHLYRYSRRWLSSDVGNFPSGYSSQSIFIVLFNIGR